MLIYESIFFQVLPHRLKSKNRDIYEYTNWNLNWKYQKLINLEVINNSWGFAPPHLPPSQNVYM